jgi:hypothetical protein
MQKGYPAVAAIAFFAMICGFYAKARMSPDLKNHQSSACSKHYAVGVLNNKGVEDNDG